MTVKIDWTKPVWNEDDLRTASAHYTAFYRAHNRKNLWLMLASLIAALAMTAMMAAA